MAALTKPDAELKAEPKLSTAQLEEISEAIVEETKRIQVRVLYCAWIMPACINEMTAEPAAVE
jgi:hypothetical protein